MAEERIDKDEPALTTRIDGEEVRLLVHIKPVDDDEPDPDDAPAKRQ